MTYLEALLEGAAVEWKPLGEVCQKTEKIGWKYIPEEREFQYIDLSSVSLLYNKIEQTQPITVATAPSRAQQIVKVDDVLFGTTRPTLKRFCVVPECYDGQICSTGFCILRANKARVLPRFLFYNLQLPSFQEYVVLNQQGAIYPVISNKKVMEFLIPLPPLRVQERIVEILDKFTALEAELEARKKQYEYYRNKLLRFGKEVEWKPLGEVAELKRGTSITQNTSTEGGYPVISGGRQPAYYVDLFNRTGETITVAGSGAYAGFLQYWNEPIFVGDAFSIKPDPSLLLTRFVYFFLLMQQQRLHDMKVGGAVPHVYTKFVAPILIPIPPLAVQEQIVAILDKFHTLVHSMSEGLPAEIALRRRQYEYYRNQLLRFPR